MLVEWVRTVPGDRLQQHTTDVNDHVQGKVTYANKDLDDVHRQSYDLCFAKRPAEELYDLKKDPEQLTNVAGDPAYIFNLGHGILPETPVDNVRVLVETVKETAGD